MIGLQTNNSIHTSSRNCFVIQREYDTGSEDYRMFVHRCEKLRVRKEEGEKKKAKLYFFGEVMQIGSIPIRTKEGKLEVTIGLLPGLIQASKEGYSFWVISDEQLVYQTDPALNVNGKIQVPNSRKRTNILIFEEEERRELAQEVDLWLYEAIAPSTQQDELWGKILKKLGFTPKEQEDPTYRAPVDMAFRHLIEIQHLYAQATLKKKRDRRPHLPHLEI